MLHFLSESGINLNAPSKGEIVSMIKLKVKVHLEGQPFCVVERDVPSNLNEKAVCEAVGILVDKIIAEAKHGNTS